MSVLFALPIAGLALFEAQMNVKHSRRMRVLFGREHAEDEGDDDENAQNPECDDDDEGDISTKEFKDLVKDFPEYVEQKSFSLRILMLIWFTNSTAMSGTGAIQQQLQELQKQVADLQKLLKGQAASLENKKET
jgi:hypothetical protein